MVKFGVKHDILTIIFGAKHDLLTPIFGAKHGILGESSIKLPSSEGLSDVQTLTDIWNCYNIELLW